MKIIGLIPARKGSKTIKNKNFVKIKGKPLIEYTLNKINKIKMLDRTFLSSNDPIIKKIAKKYSSINIDYIRPNNISLDTTSMIETVCHFSNWLDLSKIKYDYIVVLQPTSPNRNVTDVDNAIKYCVKHQFDSLMSISELMNHPNELIIKKNNRWKFFLKNSKKIYQRQQFKINPYFNDGSIYIISKKLIKKKKIFSFSNQGFYKVKKINSFDINDNEDLEVVKKIL